MSYYVNPTDGTKEQWLVKHGTSLSRTAVEEFDFASSNLPVCLIDNGLFTTAGIAYDPDERAAFLYDDGRPKRWYSVPREALTQWYKEC